MAITLTIQGKIIDFPSSAQSPNWASALVEFAEAVEAALDGVAGDYDVAPEILTISSDVNTLVDIETLSFPTANVRGAFIRYAFERSSDTTTEVETGSLDIIYNDDTGSWQSSREAVGTDTGLTFTVTNTGQVQYSTTAIGGTFVSGALTYTAQALLKSA